MRRLWLVVLLAGSELALAQRDAQRLEEQKVAASSFYLRYVRPVEGCEAYRHAEALTRIQSLIGGLRQKHPRTFDLIERHPAYVGTLHAIRMFEPDRYGGPKGARLAQEDCVKGIWSLERTREYEDGHMESLLELFSEPA